MTFSLPELSLWQYFGLGCLLAVLTHVVFRWEIIVKIWEEEQRKNPARRAQIQRFLRKFNRKSG